MKSLVLVCNGVNVFSCDDDDFAGEKIAVEKIIQTVNSRNAGRDPVFSVEIHGDEPEPVVEPKKTFFNKLTGFYEEMKNNA